MYFFEIVRIRGNNRNNYLIYSIYLYVTLIASLFPYVAFRFSLTLAATEEREEPRTGFGRAEGDRA